MKINRLNFNQLKHTIQSNKLLLDLDFKSNNELFRTQKAFSSKQTFRSGSKFDKKHRALSSATGGRNSGSVNKKQHNKNNDKCDKLPKQKQNKVLSTTQNRQRPATCSPAFSNKKQNFNLNQQGLILTRPRTATNRFYTGLQLKKSNKKQDIFLQLSKQIKRYFTSNLSPQQRNQTLQELKLLLNIIQKQPNDASIVLLHFQKLQNQLSRFLKHRISHLYFYLIYYKFISAIGLNDSTVSFAKQLKLLTLSQYHARTFYFRKVSLLICMQIQQKLIKASNYQQSRKYAIKSLKLAVLINDRYIETKMLEYLGVLKYYQGVLNVNGSNLLTEKERLNILRLYNQQEDIPKIFHFLDDSKNKGNTRSKGQKQVLSSASQVNNNAEKGKGLLSTTSMSKKQINSKQNSLKSAQSSLQSAVNQQDDIIASFDKNQLYFNQGQNFITKSIPASNLKKFNRNFHGIAKSIRKTNAVKQNIQRTTQVGKVKKFFGRDNFITLYPQGNSIKATNQSQVFITHKKYADIDRGSMFLTKELPGIIQKLETLILTEIYEQKHNDHVNNIDGNANYHGDS